MFQQPLKDDKKHSVATAVSNLRTTVKICPKVMRKKEKETNSKTNKQQQKKVYRGKCSISGKVTLLFRGEKKK